MKIKRFLAKEMRHGIRQVRETLGAEAVILSNKRVNGGVEIIAAVDYDESLLKPENLSSDDMLAASVNSPNQHNTRTPVSKSRANTANQKSNRQELADDIFSLSQQQDLPELDFSNRDDDQASGEIPRTTTRKAGSATTSSPDFSRIDFSSIEWSQDPTLMQVQNELRELRGLLEQQMSSLAWGDLNRRDPLRAKLTRCLLELGLSPSICQRIAGAVKDHNDFENTWRHALAMLVRSLPVDSTDILEQGGIVALVGATGVGKTTTIAKLAARYALRHGCESVAMVTTDSYRIAAHEQLRTYGRILDIPVRIANNHEELMDALKLLSDRDLVLIDTAGMSQRDIRLSQQFQMIQGSAPGIKTYLVLSTTTHRAGLREVVKAFGDVQLDGCILTKLDETTSLGGALATVIENELPVVYVSDGQKVPEDIHIARGHNLVQRAVLTAQDTNQALEHESLNLAFSGMVANAHG